LSTRQPGSPGKFISADAQLDVQEDAVDAAGAPERSRFLPAVSAPLPKIVASQLVSGGVFLPAFPSSYPNE
jgi:hypothetical protein